MERMIEELQEMIRGISDKNMINKLINKLAGINSLYTELDNDLRSYEQEIRRLNNILDNYKKEEYKLKRVIISSLNLYDDFKRYED